MTDLQEKAFRLEKSAVAQSLSLSMADTQQHYEVEQVEKAKKDARDARWIANVETIKAMTDDELNTLANAIFGAENQIHFNLTEEQRKRNPHYYLVRQVATTLRGVALENK